MDEYRFALIPNHAIYLPMDDQVYTWSHIHREEDIPVASEHLNLLIVFVAQGHISLLQYCLFLFVMFVNHSEEID